MWATSKYASGVTNGFGEEATMTNASRIDVQLFRSTMGRFATGVTVITTAHDDRQTHTMTVSAFLSVSLDPPLVLVSLRKQSKMNASLILGKRLGINILAASQEGYSRHFGGRPQEGLEVVWLLRQTDADPPLIDGCVAHIVARVVERHQAGDHMFYLGHVEYLRSWERRPLLTFSGRYRRIEAREPMDTRSMVNEDSW
jgi:flavin reductase (DIM6/NTAB) family NADH-FMN oxidoreductase RutF